MSGTGHGDERADDGVTDGEVTGDGVPREDGPAGDGAESDRECGELLQQSLADFLKGERSSGLEQLVDDVESICRSLTDPQWRDRLRSHWWALERVYAADMLQQGHRSLPADSRRSVEEAVAELGSAAGELASADPRAAA